MCARIIPFPDLDAEGVERLIARSRLSRQNRVIARANEGVAKDASRAARAQEIIAAVEDIRRVYTQMPQHDAKFLMYDFNDVLDKLQSRCADRMHKKVFELINRGIEGDRYAL